jgi:hypothetical protein
MAVVTTNLVTMSGLRVMDAEVSIPIARNLIKASAHLVLAVTKRRNDSKCDDFHAPETSMLHRFCERRVEIVTGGCNDLARRFFLATRWGLRGESGFS